MLFRSTINKTSDIIVMYSLYLYIVGLILPSISKILELFKDQYSNHLTISEWIQRFGSCEIYRRQIISALIIN
ncbi:MAG: hypothetical protein MRJ93_01555 [Nitrososphaeraceae archaeon]|nr:hypothetical protein [Nitrososphaeraceae archaeon]